MLEEDQYVCLNLVEDECLKPYLRVVDIETERGKIVDKPKARSTRDRTLSSHDHVLENLAAVLMTFKVRPVCHVRGKFPGCKVLLKSE